MIYPQHFQNSIIENGDKMINVTFVINFLFYMTKSHTQTLDSLKFKMALPFP